MLAKLRKISEIYQAQKLTYDKYKYSYYTLTQI